MALLGVLILLSVIKRLREKSYQAVTPFLFFFLLIIFLTNISLLRHPGLKYWVFGADFNLITQFLDPRKGIFALLVIHLVGKPNRLFRNLSISALMNCFYLIIQIVLFEIKGNWSSYFSMASSSGSALRYNMSLGYEMVFCAIVLFSLAFYRKSIFLSVLSGLAAALTLYYGSRGAILVLLTYFVIFVVFVSANQWKISMSVIKLKGRALANIAVVLILAFIIVNLIPSVSNTLKISCNSSEMPNGYESIDNEHPQVDDFGENYYSSSRTIDSLAEGEFWHDNGRFDIWRLSLLAIKENPVFGQGFFGDRLYVGEELLWGYSHNVFLEVLSHFGIFGVLLLATLLFVTFKLIASNGELLFKLVFAIIIAMCVKLLISDSYVVYIHFWTFLAMVFLGSNVFSKLTGRQWRNLLLLLLIVSVITLSVFVYTDYKRQDYSTIRIDSPTILFTIERSSANDYPVFLAFKEFGYTGVSFINAHDFSSSNHDPNVLSADAIRLMLEGGWTFEDGNYKYVNPYLDSALFQDQSKESTDIYFSKYGIDLAIAYAPPYGANNSTIVFRTQDVYSFVQNNSASNSFRTYEKISLPMTNNLQARKFTYGTDEERSEIREFLRQARETKSLAIFYVQSKDINIVDIRDFLHEVRDMGFVSTNYKELYNKAYHSTDLSFRNYIENSYLYGLVGRVFD